MASRGWTGHTRWIELVAEVEMFLVMEAMDTRRNDDTAKVTNEWQEGKIDLRKPTATELKFDAPFRSRPAHAQTNDDFIISIRSKSSLQIH